MVIPAILAGGLFLASCSGEHKELYGKYDGTLKLSCSGSGCGTDYEQVVLIISKIKEGKIDAKIKLPGVTLDPRNAGPLTGTFQESFFVLEGQKGDAVYTLECELDGADLICDVYKTYGNCKCSDRSVSFMKIN